MSMLHVTVDAACPLSTLYVHFPAAFPCPSCISMVVLHVHVFAACPCHDGRSCPCCVSMFMLSVAACPYGMSMMLVHDFCPSCMSILHVHSVCYSNAAYPCPWSMHAPCPRLHAACTFCMYMLLFYVTCPLSMLHVRAACPCCCPLCMPMLHVHKHVA